MKERERTRLVVDDTTIYEVDLDCEECQNREDLKMVDRTETAKNQRRQRRSM